MANLGTREKIIIGIVGILILYAAVDILTPKKKTIEFDMKQKTEELKTFVTTLSTGIGKDAPNSIGVLVFSRAEKDWAGDPFLDDKSFRAWSQTRELVKDSVVAPKIEFVYSGYLEIKGKRMAIINGMEYGEGEALDVKGYVLKSVSPTGVVIENRRIGATVNVPLLE